MVDRCLLQLYLFAPLVAYGSLSVAASGCEEPVIDAIRGVQKAVDSLHTDGRSTAPGPGVAAVIARGLARAT